MKASELLAQSYSPILIFFAIGFAATLTWTAFVRLLNGASPAVLLKTRFYELPPMRGLIYDVHIGLWGLCLTAGWVVLSQGYWGFAAISREGHIRVAVIANSHIPICTLFQLKIIIGSTYS